MKRLIFSLLFVSTIFISSAQDKSEHLSFKGVPIDGTLNEYVSKMKADRVFISWDAGRYSYSAR